MNSWPQYKVGQDVPERYVQDDLGEVVPCPLAVDDGGDEEQWEGFRQ